MAQFITCEAYPSVTYLRGETLENHAINIDMVQVISKGRLRWYPDNLGLPTIEFTFRNGTEKWTFKNDNDRDLEYEYIMQRFGAKHGTKAQD